MSFSVIIPSRTDSNLHACVDAIREAGETCRVIVVDDGLKDRRADCEYVQGVKPFVYARNCNLGIAAASGLQLLSEQKYESGQIATYQSSKPDILLLNDDCTL